MRNPTRDLVGERAELDSDTRWVGLGGRLGLCVWPLAPRQHGVDDRVVGAVVEQLLPVDVRDVEAAGLHPGELLGGLFEEPDGRGSTSCESDFGPSRH
jgi:hypothetical protein